MPMHRSSTDRYLCGIGSKKIIVINWETGIQTGLDLCHESSGEDDVSIRV